MATTPRSVIIGIFRDHTLAEQAMQEFKQTDWGVNDIHILSENSGGVLDALTHIFTARETNADPDELTAFNLPQDQHQLCLHELEHGSSIVIAHLETHLQEGRDLLNRYGASHVFIPFHQGEEQTIPLRQEVIQVQKSVVDIGEVRIHKRIITEEKTFAVSVMREEVTIERVPVPSISPTSDPSHTQLGSTVARQQENTNAEISLSPRETEMLREAGTIRISVREEQVIIQKQPIIVEEIVVQKQIVQETKHLVEPTRHEEIRIERLGNAPIQERLPDAATQ